MAAWLAVAWLLSCLVLGWSVLSLAAFLWLFAFVTFAEVGSWLVLCVLALLLAAQPPSPSASNNTNELLIMALFNLIVNTPLTAGSITTSCLHYYCNISAIKM